MLTSPSIKQEYHLPPVDVDPSLSEEQPETGPLDWWAILLILAACVFVLLLLERYLGVYMPDDAYITYRYAENLATGHGLVFNAATPPVEGYSNLLWILLLALLAQFGLSVPVWASNL